MAGLSSICFWVRPCSSLAEVLCTRMHSESEPEIWPLAVTSSGCRPLQALEKRNCLENLLGHRWLAAEDDLGSGLWGRRLNCPDSSAVKRDGLGVSRRLVDAPRHVCSSARPDGLRVLRCVLVRAERVEAEVLRGRRAAVRRP